MEEYVAKVLKERKEKALQDEKQTISIRPAFAEALKKSQFQSYTWTSFSARKD